MNVYRDIDWLGDKGKDAPTQGLRIESPATEEPSKKRVPNVYDLFGPGTEPPGEVSPIIRPPQARRPIDPEEENIRPGSSSIANRLYQEFGPPMVSELGKRIRRQFSSGYQVAHRGASSMLSLVGGGDPILPSVPRDWPLRPVLEVGRRMVDPVVGAAALGLGTLGMITSPIFGVAEKPAETMALSLGASPETAKKIGFIGGSLLENFMLMGAGTALTVTKAIPVKALGRLVGGISKRDPIQPYRKKYKTPVMEGEVGRKIEDIAEPYDLPIGVAPNIPEDSAFAKFLGDTAVPHYKQASDFVSHEIQREGNKVLVGLGIEETSGILFKNLNKLAKARGKTVDEMQVIIGEAFKNPVADKPISDAAKPFREWINKLVKEGEGLGLIDKDMADRSIDRYVYRSYLSKEYPLLNAPTEIQKEAARVDLRATMRIPVAADDPLRAASSRTLEAARRKDLTQWQNDVRSKTKDLGPAIKALESTKKQVIGVTKEGLKNIKEMVRTVKNPGTIREVLVKNMVDNGWYTDADAQLAVRTFLGTGTRPLGKNDKQKILKLLTEHEGIGTRAGGKLKITEADIRARQKRLSVVERQLDDEQARRLGVEAIRKGELPPIVVKDVNSILGRARKTFDDMTEELKRMKKDNWSKEEVEIRHAQFREELKQKYGEGPVIYRNATPDEIEAKLLDLINGGEGDLHLRRGGSTSKIPMGPLTPRKDISEPLRVVMGEIKDGTLMAAITVDKLSRMNLATKFLNSFSKGSEVIGNQRVRWVIDEALAGYKQVNGKEWGALNGKYVLGKYWDHLNDFTQSMMPKLDESGKTSLFNYAQMISGFSMNVFKVSKTVLNPATHIRNIGGNTSFADFAGNAVWNPMNWKYYYMAGRELMRSGKGFVASQMRKRGTFLRHRKEGLTPVVREAIAHGALQTEFVGSEVLQSVAKSFAEVNPMKAMLIQMQRPIKAIGRIYNAEDQIFKLATYMKQRRFITGSQYGKGGASAVDAARHINTWFPNYRDTTRVVKKLRTAAWGAPFVTFTAEAARIYTNAAKHHPIKFVKWMALPASFSAGAAAMVGMSPEEVTKIMKSLPDYLRQPFTTIVPFRDKNGDIQIADGTYWHPLGAMWAGRRHGQLDIPVLGEFVLSNPIINTALEIFMNRDFFTGQPIYGPGDLTAVEIGRKIAKEFLPSLTPGVGAGAKEISKAIRRQRGEKVLGRYGQELPLSKVLAGEVAGMRAIPVDRALRFAGYRRVQTRMREIEQAIRGIPGEIMRGLTREAGERKMKRLAEEARMLMKQNR